MNTDRPLRVAVYTDSTTIGGAEISLGHLVATADPATQITAIGVSAAVLERITTGRPQTPQIVLPARGLASILAHCLTWHRLRPDIIHVNLCTPWAAAIGLVTALTLPQTRVVRVDQLPLRTTAALQLWRTRWLALRVDANVAVGEASARRVEDFYALGRHSVVSIPNGVPDRGEPAPLADRPPGELIVGSIGRLDPMKAHEILLRAIAQVEGVKAVILGEGGERYHLEQLATSLGITDRIELRGWVAQPQDYLGEFDAIVQPSRSEGFPLAIVEAMLAARPVIATPVGSVAEAVIDGKTGILVEKNHVEELAAALRRLRDDPKLRSFLGQQGRALAVAQFTVEQMTASYEHLWRQVRARPPAPRWWVPRPKD